MSNTTLESYLDRRADAERSRDSCRSHVFKMGLALHDAVMASQFRTSGNAARSVEASSLCEELHALRVAGFLGDEVDGESFTEIRDIWFNARESGREVLFDRYNLQVREFGEYQNGGSYSTTRAFAFAPDGSMCPDYDVKFRATQTVGRDERAGVKNLTLAPVDVTGAVFRRTLVDLGWPPEVVERCRSEADYRAEMDARPELGRLADPRVPFHAPAEERLRAARELPAGPARSSRATGKTFDIPPRPYVTPTPGDDFSVGASYDGVRREGVVRGYVGVESDVVIPEISSGGERVEVVGDGAFRGRSDVSRVEMPATVGEVWEGAFDGCSNLEILVASPRLRLVARDAFRGCDKLREVETGMTRARWAEVRVESGNEALERANLTFRAPTREEAVSAEDRARRDGRPVAGVIRSPSGDAYCRSRVGLEYALRLRMDPATGKLPEGTRLVIPRGAGDAERRLVHAAVCDAHDRPAVDFDAWSRDKCRPSPAPRRGAVSRAVAAAEGLATPGGAPEREAGD